MDLSITIVSFNTRDRLRACLQAVFASITKYQYEVFVVDNASSDGSVQMVAAEFPRVKLIKNSENLGYAKANNLALRQAQGRFILLLNPDVEIASETFDKMISFMDNDKSIGIAGCRVVKSDGSLDKASRRNFPDIKNAVKYFLGLRSTYHLDLPDSEVAEVDSVMGAFLMIREDVVSKVGLLDEGFFMYGEDLDWCWRVKAAGFKVIYAPVTTVVHHKGSSSRKLPGKALYEFHKAMWIFYDKHYAREHSGPLNYLVKLAIWARYLLKFIQNSIRKDKYVSR